MDTQQVIAAPVRRGLPAAKLDQVVSFIEARLGDGLKLHELAASVREAGAVIDEFELVKPDLEEVFVQVMGQH